MNAVIRASAYYTIQIFVCASVKMLRNLALHLANLAFAQTLFLHSAIARMLLPIGAMYHNVHEQVPATTCDVKQSHLGFVFVYGNVK